MQTFGPSLRPLSSFLVLFPSAEVSKQYRDNPVPHVYSVQKILPVDPAILCVAEREQAKEIASRSDATNCVKDNRHVQGRMRCSR